MASIFDQYGIKEVVDGTFYALEDNKRLDVLKGQPVLFLDTLKVSTAEVTADQSDAKGGRGNTTLIIWDFNKEVTITLQDALISPLSLALISGGSVEEATALAPTTIQQRGVFVAKAATEGEPTADIVIPSAAGTLDTDAVHYAIYNKKRYFGTAVGNTISFTSDAKGLTDASFAYEAEVEVFYSIKITGATGDATTITIDSANFPGTYKFVGDTVIRSQQTGADEPFQMVIEKCKMNSEFSLTMEAEGDPSTLDMNLRVLRDNDGNMIKFIKYNLD